MYFVAIVILPRVGLHFSNYRAHACVLCGRHTWLKIDEVRNLHANFIGSAYTIGSGEKRGRILGKINRLMRAIQHTSTLKRPENSIKHASIVIRERQQYESSLGCERD